MAIVPPSKTFTPGLEFKNRQYFDPAEKFQIEAAAALRIVGDKLSVLGEVKALVKLTFGDVTYSNPPIFIDAREREVQLLKSVAADVDPDVQVIIKPEYIIRFHEGTLDPRMGLFMDARTYEPSTPKGNIPKLIRFADLLSKSPPRLLGEVKNLHGLTLPQPTEDIEQIKRDLIQFGYGLVKNALSPREVDIIKKAVLEQAAGERQAGVATFDGGPDGPNQRVWNLINKGDEFIDLLNHPLIDAIIPWFLGDHAHISTLSANIARPGNVPMQLHTDQSSKTPPQRELAMGLNISFYLVDTTNVNGATRVYPGSHRGNVAPSDIWTVEGSIAAEGPAGTAVVFDNRLWHTTGPNRATEGELERPVILLHFVRSFVRAGENHYLSLRKDVEAKLPDRQKAFFGFRKIPGMGSVEGNTAPGFVTRTDNAIGALRVS
ncbi:phytanoyl- dioxygenase family protein [Colletotrichum incanum]|uniref:Phytanoyl-dioxygenase family protein n=1 Tax=Colletotrichum incanum TaxID=1573173 RepID=A0A166XH81_COLIC|nr:phytanoyl- dioxygenase family protein [Colletotrichum incanum]OHW99195.1 phytanoyl-dioxygenase [Colletotrichum incanum]